MTKKDVIIQNPMYNYSENASKTRKGWAVANETRAQLGNYSENASKTRKGWAVANETRAQLGNYS